jgi:hypothetical protein
MEFVNVLRRHRNGVGHYDQSISVRKVLWLEIKPVEGIYGRTHAMQGPSLGVEMPHREHIEIARTP